MMELVVSCVLSSKYIWRRWFRNCLTRPGSSDGEDGDFEGLQDGACASTGLLSARNAVGGSGVCGCCVALRPLICPKHIQCAG